MNEAALYLKKKKKKSHNPSSASEPSSFPERAAASPHRADGDRRRLGICSVCLVLLPSYPPHLLCRLLPSSPPPPVSELGAPPGIRLNPFLLRPILHHLQQDNDEGVSRRRRSSQSSHCRSSPTQLPPSKLRLNPLFSATLSVVRRDEVKQWLGKLSGQVYWKPLGRWKRLAGLRAVSTKMAGPVKNVYKRGEGRFRLYRKSWSYRRRRHQRKLILSDIRDQGPDATCLYNAICGVMEAKLCMQGIIVKLSVEHLAMMASDWISCTSGSQQRCLSTELPTILNNLACAGICTDEDFKKGCVTGPRYKIRSYEMLSWFIFTTADAVHKLRERGPLLAVIKISSNFASDFLSGRVYRFDKAKCVPGRQIRTHAVISTGYAVDNLLPMWEMQNSHGEVGVEKGFGYFDFDSLVGLYSLNIDA